MAAQDYEQVTYNGPAGAQIGQSATEKVAFHGATPVVQASFVATVSVVYVTVSGVYGFSTATAISNVLTLLNAMQTILVNKGLMAAS